MPFHEDRHPDKQGKGKEIVERRIKEQKTKNKKYQSNKNARNADIVSGLHKSLSNHKDKLPTIQATTMTFFHKDKKNELKGLPAYQSAVIPS